MHHSNQVQFLTPHMPSHVVLVVLVLSCGMRGLVHPVARSGPSELPVVPISQLCPLYQTEAEAFVHWPQVFSSFIKAWGPAIILPGLSKVQKSQISHCSLVSWLAYVYLSMCYRQEEQPCPPLPAPITSPVSVLVPVYLPGQLHHWAGSTHPVATWLPVPKCKGKHQHGDQKASPQ